MSGNYKLRQTCEFKLFFRAISPSTWLYENVKQAHEVDGNFLSNDSMTTTGAIVITQGAVEVKTFLVSYQRDSLRSRK